MASFVAGFTGQNVMTLVQKTDKSIVAVWSDTWNGNQMVHIRDLYVQGGVWNPGKGVCVKAEDFDALLVNIVAWAKAHHTISPKPVEAAIAPPLSSLLT